MTTYQRDVERLASPVASELAKGFRQDINGLRAWAVMAVVLYHFGVPFASGGFVGVDVFFVISGYLMTGIICTGLQREKFSVWGFYLARAKRILPALIVVALVVLVVGWFIMMPKEYQTLGRHARESLTFSSNLRYLKESGYFDSDAHGKWLLHTWSLSVEWQFYVLLPLLLSVVWRLFPRRSALVVAHVLLLLASFATCVLLTEREPSKAFYVLQSRAWEMLVGGLVFLLGSAPRISPGRRFIELLGFALIVGAVVGLDSASRWPGWLAVLPTAGAALVLLAWREDSLWSGARAMQWLGTRSYSIYLWHWPIVAALAYCARLDSPTWVGFGLVGSLLLGMLSYATVEVPARRLLGRGTPRRAAAYLFLALLAAVLAAQAVRRNGFPQRLPSAVAEIEAQRSNRNPRLDECLGKGKACIFGSEPVAAMVLGDSHADAVVTAVQAALPEHRQQGVYFRGVSSCLLVFGAQVVDERRPGKCAELKQDMQSGIDTLYPGVPVVVVNRTSVYVRGVTVKAAGFIPGRPWVYFSAPQDSATPEFLEEFRRHYLATACAIARQHPLFLVRPIPEMPANVPQAMGKAMLLGGSREVSLPLESYRQRNAFVWALQDEAHERCGAQILDPLPYLCDDKVCHGSKDGLPIYADGDHLNEFGNRLLVPMFSKVFSAKQSSGLMNEASNSQRSVGN